MPATITRWYGLDEDVEVRHDHKLVPGTVVRLGRIMDTVRLTDGTEVMRYTFEVYAPETYCDNCDEPIEWLGWDGLIGGPEWVHVRSKGPECRNDAGRLMGSAAEPEVL